MSDNFEQTADPKAAIGGDRGVTELHLAIWEQELSINPDLVAIHVSREGTALPNETIVAAHRRIHEALL